MADPTLRRRLRSQPPRGRERGRAGPEGGRQRYDLKGTAAGIEQNEKDASSLTANDDFGLKAVNDILQTKLVKRGVSLKALDDGEDRARVEGHRAAGREDPSGHRVREGAGDREGGQGQQAEGSGRRSRASSSRLGQEEGRPAGRDRPPPRQRTSGSPSSSRTSAAEGSPRGKRRVPRPGRCTEPGAVKCTPAEMSQTSLKDRLSSRRSRRGAENGRRLLPALAPIEDKLKRVETELQRADALGAIPTISLIGDYLVEGGGKRIRPALLLLGAHLLGYEGDRDVELRRHRSSSSTRPRWSTTTSSTTRSCAAAGRA